MKRTCGILFAVVLMAFLAGNVFAREMMERTDQDKDVQSPGTRRMMRMNMMRDRMGGTGMTRRGGRGRTAMMKRGRMAGRSGMMAGLADELDLSEEQKSVLDDIFTTHKKNMIMKKAEREIAEFELRKLMQQEEPDLNDLQGKIRMIADLEAEIRYSRIIVRIEAKNVLTEEQRAAFKELRKDRRAQRTGRRKGRIGGPGPKRGPARHRR